MSENSIPNITRLHVPISPIFSLKIAVARGSPGGSPGKKILCRSVPTCAAHSSPANSFLQRLSAHHSALCRVVPHLAESCLKHPFLYGVQEVASSNLAGPTTSDPCKIQGFAGGGGFGLKSQSIHGVNTQRRAACLRGTGRGVKSDRFSSGARRRFRAASRYAGRPKAVRNFAALRIF